MAYQALYRTWRPMVFDDVAGQEHITQTLRNEIKTDSLAHAYLFCGTRGTGKTSTAKILARAVNCEHPIDGNPCNECPTCKGILDDSILDVVEIDAASRNKVENIRDLIDDVIFLPTQAKKKVYIIDEVHMVTTQAFNALLKTLEEPPAHVLFILATTDLNKIPATVLSRCQRFDFKRISLDAITARLTKIITASGRTVAPEAVQMIAELGDGSMRDSLSILEQVLGYSEDSITYNDLLSIIGITDYDALFQMCEAFSAGDAGSALTVFDRAIENGKEPDVLIDRLVHFLRDLMVVKLTRDPAAIVHTSPEHLQRMKTLCQSFTKEKLIFSLKLLNEAVINAKASAGSRTVYELALVKLCQPSYDASVEALCARVADLEAKLAGGISFVSSEPSAANAAPAVAEAAPMQSSDDVPPWDMPPMPTEPDAPPAPPVQEDVPPIAPAPQTLAQSEPGTAILAEADKESASAPASSEGEPLFVSRWNEVKEYIRGHRGMPIIPHLNRATPMLLNQKLALVFPQEAAMNKTVTARPATLTLIHEAVLAVTGEDFEVQCLSEKEAGVPKSNDDAFSKLMDLAKEHSEIEIL